MTPFPWEQLPRVSGPSVRLGRDLHRLLGASAETIRFEQAFERLLGERVHIEWLGFGGGGSVEGGWTRVDFRDPHSGSRFECRVQTAFAAWLLGRLLRRPGGLLDETAGIDDPRLRGALSGFACEWARAAGVPLALFSSWQGGDLTADRARYRLRVGSGAYAAEIGIALAALPPSSPPALASLGGLPITVPLVAGVCTARRSDLSRLEPGDAWLPGGGLWIDNRGEGELALCPATCDSGIRVRSEAGKLRIERSGRTLAGEEEAAMTHSPDSTSSEQIETTILDAPVLVRLEVGSVSMLARDWAELRPGDVIRSGRPVGELVTLRVSGRAVATGELVDVDGELGVRVRTITNEGDS